MNRKRIDTLPTKKPTSSLLKQRLAVALLEAYGLPYKLTTTGKVMTHYIVQLNDIGYFWHPGAHAWNYRPDYLLDRQKRKAQREAAGLTP